MEAFTAVDTFFCLNFCLGDRVIFCGRSTSRFEMECVVWIIDDSYIDDYFVDPHIRDL